MKLPAQVSVELCVADPSALGEPDSPVTHTVGCCLYSLTCVSFSEWKTSSTERFSTLFTSSQAAWSYGVSVHFKGSHSKVSPRCLRQGKTPSNILNTYERQVIERSVEMTKMSTRRRSVSQSTTFAQNEISPQMLDGPLWKLEQTFKAKSHWLWWSTVLVLSEMSAQLWVAEIWTFMSVTMNCTKL